MSTPKTYEAQVIVTSSWYGNVHASTLPDAETAARDAFNGGALKQWDMEITYIQAEEVTP